MDTAGGGGHGFLGHGMVGFGRPAPWVTYFGVVGIGHDTAYALMPWVAIMDVSMALIALFVPIRAFVFFMTGWAWTALLRPLAGESCWEALERAGNYGAPLALFLVLNEARLGDWLRSSVARFMEERRRMEVCWVLRLQRLPCFWATGRSDCCFTSRSLPPITRRSDLGGPRSNPGVGALEIMLAAIVFVRPSFSLLVFAFAWKVATELLNPIAGSSFWVFVEHGGSYAAPLALAFLQIAWIRDETAERDPGVADGVQAAV